MKTFSKHAQVRIQQRGISSEQIYLVQHYGTTKHVRGAMSIYMDNSARKRARNSPDGTLYRKHADRLNFYLVLSDDEHVITVAHQTQKTPHGRRKPRRYRSPE